MRRHIIMWCLAAPWSRVRFYRRWYLEATDESKLTSSTWQSAMICEYSDLIRPWRLMNVRIPVMVPRGILWESSLEALDSVLFPGLLALSMDRHYRVVKTKRRSRLPSIYQVFFLLGNSAGGTLSLTFDTKVRKAVAAVMMSAKFAAMNCQYVSQSQSI